MEQGLGRLWNKLASTPQVSSSNSPARRRQPQIQHSKSYVWDLQRHRKKCLNVARVAVPQVFSPGGPWRWTDCRLRFLLCRDTTLVGHFGSAPCRKQAKSSLKVSGWRHSVPVLDCRSNPPRCTPGRRHWVTKKQFPCRASSSSTLFRP